MCWSAIGRAKLMMIGSPTPTVVPLTGLKVGGTNGGAPVNGSGFWPTTGPVGAAAWVAGAPGAPGVPGVPGGTAGAGADGSPGGGGTAAGLGDGGTASGSAGGGGGAGAPGSGGAGASTPGAGGGGGSGSASAKPLPNTSAAITPTALNAAARGPVVHRDICIPPSHGLQPVCSSGGPSY